MEQAFEYLDAPVQRVGSLKFQSHLHPRTAVLQSVPLRLKTLLEY